MKVKGMLREVRIAGCGELRLCVVGERKDREGARKWHAVTVPDTARNRAAFTLGRRVTVEIKTRAR